MTRGRMITEMTNSEFVHWTRFYARKAQQDELDRKLAGG